MYQTTNSFEVKVPASTANLGPGFDSFGLALPLYLTIRVRLQENMKIKLIGENLEGLPTDESNLVYKTIKYLFDKEKQEMPSFELEIYSDIPLSRGLGSSGSAIIGGLLVANQLLPHPKTKEELLGLAAKLEGHADNIGASLYGGFVVTAFDGKQAKLEKVSFPEGLRIILAIPKYTLSTTLARKQIPEKIPVKDAAFNIGHATLLVTYLLTGQLDKLQSAMLDKLHQPYRQRYVKGLEKVMNQSAKYKFFTAALSGAGPTILLLTKDETVNPTKEILCNIVKEENMDVEIKVLTYEKEGSIVLQQQAH